MSDLSGLGDLAPRSEFCYLYNSNSCTGEKVGNYECMPSCLPQPDCGGVFCSTFATMSEACGNVGILDSTLIRSRQQSCLAEYSDSLTEEGLGVTEVMFVLTIVLPDVDFDALNGDADAQQAIYDSISQLLPGVTSVTGFVAVDSRRRKLQLFDRRKLAGSASINVDVTAIPTAPSASAEEAVDNFVDDLTASIDNGVFATVVTNNVKNLGVTIIPTASIVSVSSSSIGSSGVVYITTASPTYAPTRQPSASPTTEEGTSPSSSSGGGDGATVAIAVVFSLLGAGLLIYALYYWHGRGVESSIGVFGTAERPTTGDDEVVLGEIYGDNVLVANEMDMNYGKGESGGGGGEDGGRSGRSILDAIGKDKELIYQQDASKIDAAGNSNTNNENVAASTGHAANIGQIARSLSGRVVTMYNTAAGRIGKRNNNDHQATIAPVVADEVNDMSFGIHAEGGGPCFVGVLD